MKVYWFDKDDLFPAVINCLEESDVVLDIGCGIVPQSLLRPSVHICCEPFVQYIDHLQEKIRTEYDRTYVILNATWAEVVDLFPHQSVDTVFLVDVVEHLKKEEALDLLKKTESLARKQIAIFTPLGFLPQKHSDGKDAWGLDGAHWQEHKSGWQPEDFDESWEIYATKTFHTTDNMGKSFDTAYGAMWAIKTFKVASEKNNINLDKKLNIRKVHNLAIDIKGNGFLSLFIFFMRLTLKCINTNFYNILYGYVLKKTNAIKRVWPL